MTEQIMDMARSLGHVDGGQEEALEALCEMVHAEPVQCIGRRFVLYRRSRQPKIELP